MKLFLMGIPAGFLGVLLSGVFFFEAFFLSVFVFLAKPYLPIKESLPFLMYRLTVRRLILNSLHISETLYPFISKEITSFSLFSFLRSSCKVFSSSSICFLSFPFSFVFSISLFFISFSVFSISSSSARRIWIPSGRFTVFIRLINSIIAPLNIKAKIKIVTGQTITSKILIPSSHVAHSIYHFSRTY